MREKCLYSELFWYAFSRIWTDYREIFRISPYSVRTWGNTDQNKSEYGHFLRSNKTLKYLIDAGESRIFHLKFVAGSYIKIGKTPRQYMKSFRKNISVNILKPNFCSLHFREGQQIGLLEGNSIRDFAFLNLSIHFYSGDTRFYEYLF